MSADIGFSVALCISTVMSCYVRRYRCSGTVAENAPTKSYRVEHKSDNFVGVGIDGVRREGVKVTELRRVGGYAGWQI